MGQLFYISFASTSSLAHAHFVPAADNWRTAGLLVAINTYMVMIITFMPNFGGSGTNKPKLITTWKLVLLEVEVELMCCILVLVLSFWRHS